MARGRMALPIVTIRYRMTDDRARRAVPGNTDHYTPPPAPHLPRGAPYNLPAPTCLMNSLVKSSNTAERSIRPRNALSESTTATKRPD